MRSHWNSKIACNFLAVNLEAVFFCRSTNYQNCLSLQCLLCCCFDCGSGRGGDYCCCSLGGGGEMRWRRMSYLGG